MLEVNLHCERVAAGRIELEFIVIAEPVEFRPLRNRPNGGQVPGLRILPGGKGGRAYQAQGAGGYLLQEHTAIDRVLLHAG